MNSPSALIALPLMTELVLRRETAPAARRALAACIAIVAEGVDEVMSSTSIARAFAKAQVRLTLRRTPELAASMTQAMDAHAANARACAQVVRDTRARIAKAPLDDDAETATWLRQAQGA